MSIDAGLKVIRFAVMFFGLMVLALTGTAALAESRHALVIGNDHYPNFPREERPL